MAAPPVIAATRTTLVSTTLSVYERVAQTTLALPCKLIPGPTRHVVPMPDQSRHSVVCGECRDRFGSVWPSPGQEMKRLQNRRRARSVTAGTQQPCWPSPSGAHEAMLMEDTSSVMDWLSPVPLGLRNGRQGDSGRVARHSTFTSQLLTQLPKDFRAAPYSCKIL